MNEQKKTIPEFKSVEEQADFWDTHSFADYWDDLKPVEVKFAANAFGSDLAEVMAVRLDRKTVSDLRQVATKKGLSPTTLIRMWVKERLYS